MSHNQQRRFITLVLDTIQTLYTEEAEEAEPRITAQIGHLQRILQRPGLKVAEILRTDILVGGILTEPCMTVLLRLASAPNVHPAAAELFHLILRAIPSKDIDTRTSMRRTLLMDAAMMNTPLPLIRALLERGADPNATNGEGETPVMFAAEQGHSHTLEALIEYGGDIHRRDHHERTALHHAASANRRDTVRLLLDHGAEIDLQNENGATPLIDAARWPGQHDTVQYLLNQGAEPHLQNKTGANVWNLANENTLDILAPHFPNRELNQNQAGGRTPRLLLRKTHHRKTKSHRRRATIRRSKTHRRRR